ncbi:MAG: hypothetical protein NTY07_09605 [Bacteroidia bacterium]|nr:hypothetical protein [Bacteroidia bacterium]
MILWSTAIILISISLGFSIKQTQQLKCAGVKVDITDSIQEKFVRSADISQWVNRNHPRIFGQPLGSVDLRKIEDGLRNLQSVEDVAYQCFR